MPGVFITPPLKASLHVEIEYDVNNNPTYVGNAAPGTNVSEPRWRIMRITYDAMNNPLSTMWADGNSNFDKVWTSRASYSYS